MVLKCVNMCLDRGLSLEMIPHLWFQAENETNMTCVCLCVVSVYLCNRCRTGCISIELRFIDLYENNSDMHAHVCTFISQFLFQCISYSHVFQKKLTHRHCYFRIYINSCLKVVVCRQLQRCTLRSNNLKTKTKLDRECFQNGFCFNTIYILLMLA